MQYEEALEAWGAKRLMELYSSSQAVKVENVQVLMYFDEGYACCGGSNPDCYCSFAESPRAEVRISGKAVYKSGTRRQVTTSIDPDEFNFAEILREICESADGVVSLE